MNALTSPSGFLGREMQCLAVAAVLLTGSMALAGISDDVFIITVSNANGSGAVTVRFRDCTYDASKLKTTWTLAAPVEIIDSGGGRIATVQSASLTVRKFVRLNMAASIDAGDLETTVTMQSPYLTFPAVATADAQGQASIAANVKDLNGDGFRLSTRNNAVFHADFNAVAPNGPHFAELLSGIEGGADGSATASQTDPASGYRLVGAEVSSLSCRVEFSLSPGDRATVSCAYRIIPEPSCSGDADGDLTPDCVDDCPNDGGKITPGLCGCGVSDVDSDEDGTPDCADSCPDGGTPGPCGCAEVVDSDGDGTPDCTDACPDDSSKSSPGACGCGNSEADSDGDGTPDCVDEAPTNSELGNTDSEDDSGGGSEGSNDEIGGGGSSGTESGTGDPQSGEGASTNNSEDGSSPSSGGDASTVDSAGGDAQADEGLADDSVAVAEQSGSGSSDGTGSEAANGDLNAVADDNSSRSGALGNFPVCSGVGLTAPLVLSLALYLGVRRAHGRRA